MKVAWEKHKERRGTVVMPCREQAEAGRGKLESEKGVSRGQAEGKQRLREQAEDAHREKQICIEEIRDELFRQLPHHFLTYEGGASEKGNDGGDRNTSR
jgi:hypothetical protein